ncbi:MAG: hypothetical protein IPM69_03255 [Ignavibacteria bacterium]|nr:hypothetical protein [Ignavibacteria bacterium]
MKTLLSIIVIGFVVILPLLAQDTISSHRAIPHIEKFVNVYDYSIGLKSSNFSGYGVCISKNLSNEYVFQFTGMIDYNENIKWNDMSKSKETKNQTDILYNVGIELKRSIYSNENSFIYALLGSYYGTDNNKNLNSESNTSTLSLGIGLGGEWYVNKYLSGNFEIGYKFDNSDIIENTSPSIVRKTGVGFGVGFLYHF